MTEENNNTAKLSAVTDPLLNSLFKVGAHVGYSRTRRHPSTMPFIYGTKNRRDLINLADTKSQLEAAANYAISVIASGGKILFVGTKPEARDIIREKAAGLDMPFVEHRWVGGTLTNFKEIRKRVDMLLDLVQRKAEDKLVFRTKKERLLIERKISKLEQNFSGLRNLEKLPQAIFVVDALKEKIAVTEASRLGIPVIAIASTDCDISDVTYPIVANDSSIASVVYLVTYIMDKVRSTINS